MPRIVGIDIPEHKKIAYALSYIKGIGIETGEQIVTALNLDGAKRAKDLTEDEVSAITTYIDEHYRVEEICAGRSVITLNDLWRLARIEVNAIRKICRVVVKKLEVMHEQQKGHAKQWVALV